MPVNVYVLLDRSGSMEGRWVEALSTINGFVAGLAKAGHEGAVTVAAFDGFAAGTSVSQGKWMTATTHSRLQFDILRQSVFPQSWQLLTREDSVPRGDTPLYDAIARLCSLADADQNPRGQLLIMTDGQENASREVTRTGASGMLERQRARGWDVIHLGVDFHEVAQQAASLGTGFGKTASMSRGAMMSGAAADFLAHNTRSYAAGGASASVITDEDRAKLGAKS